MARKREIKPSFYMDEDLAECSVWARLLFPALWQLADREGRLEDRPAMIRIHAFPYDSLEALGVSVNDCLNELARPRKHCPEGAGFIFRYVVDGRPYIQIRGFKKHQRPHPNEVPSVLPGPEQVTARTTKVDSANSQSEQRSVLQSKPSGSSVPSGSACTLAHQTDDPPAYVPPDERTEQAIRAGTVALERKLLSAVGRLSERVSRDALSLMREVTAYKRADGTTVPGRSNPSGLTSERLEKSLEDAEAWLASLPAPP